MAGPVPTYLTTQLAAQTAFTVPFGLLALVNGAITTATAAGQFNTTVDCSLFTAEDVSNVRIYLDSLGYLVEFAKGGGEKSLLIDWGKPLDIDGDGGGSTTVIQGTIPWIVAEAPSPTGVTLFATSDTVPSGIETTILTYTVPVVSFHIRQLVAWGTYDGEFLIRKNGTIVGGGRTSTADRTLNIAYEAGQIPTTNGDTITVTILYYNVNTSGVHQFRCNLIGE
jgi:hypothetical protein